MGVAAGVGTGVGTGVTTGCAVGTIVGTDVTAGVPAGDTAGCAVTDGCTFTSVCNVAVGAVGDGDGEGVATTGVGLAQPVARNDDRIMMTIARLTMNFRYI